MAINVILTGAIVSYCASQMGSSVGAAVYDIVKHVADYVWLKPEEGYFLDYPDDPEKETNMRTVMKRLQIMMQHEKRHTVPNA